ncbi:Alcohol dehydrogenase-like 6 [Linum perenne]
MAPSFLPLPLLPQANFDLCLSPTLTLRSPPSQAIFPRIFGHKALRIVESIGDGVTEFKEGDHVLTVFIGECRTCKHCTSGKSNVCQLKLLELQTSSTQMIAFNPFNRSSNVSLMEEQITRSNV